MFKILDSLKYRLSHINAHDWHWRLTRRIFGKKARGKACTYYWFKVPVSMLSLVFLFILNCLYWIIRVLVIAVAWFIGYRFNEGVFDSDSGVSEGFNYQGYKTRLDGTKYKFAPWEISLIPLAGWLFWLLAFVHPNYGKLLLYVFGISLTSSILIYLLTAGWKLAPIISARAEVKSAWDKICPTLVVEEKGSKK